MDSLRQTLNRTLFLGLFGLERASHSTYPEQVSVPSGPFSGHERAGFDGSGLTKLLGVEDEPHVASDHTGLAGAEVNVRVHRALRGRQRGH
jgi:hypothetical protein